MRLAEYMVAQIKLNKKTKKWCTNLAYHKIIAWTCPRKSLKVSLLVDFINKKNSNFELHYYIRETDPKQETFSCLNFSYWLRLA